MSSSPGARSLVAATETGRVGVIGTVGTISSGAYQRAVAALGVDVELSSCGLPGLRGVRRAGRDLRRRGHRAGRAATGADGRGRGRHAAAGLHPLPVPGPRHRRRHGPRRRARELRRRDRLRGGRRCWARRACAASPTGPGSHRWYSSGDVAWFADLGRRLLGPELASAERCTFDEPGGDPCPHVPTAAHPTSCARSPSNATSPTWRPARCSCRSAAPRGVHGVGRRGRAALDARHRQGMGHRGVLDAARLVAERIDREAAKRQAERSHHGDPAADRPLAARRHRHASRWARSRSPSTATCCRPTAARARPRSAAATSRCTTPCRGWCRPACCGPTRSSRTAPRSASASSTACRCSTCRTSEDSKAEVDMNVVMTSEGRFVEVQGTAEGKAFSRGELDSLLALADAGIARDLRAADGVRGRAAAAAAAGAMTAAAPLPSPRCWRRAIPTRWPRSGRSSATGVRARRRSTRA